jgi:hypothetical protein
MFGSGGKKRANASSNCAALGRYGFVATRHIGNILVVPANGVGHHPLDYNHPRSLKAERSTPGGPYHPPRHIGRQASLRCPCCHNESAVIKVADITYIAIATDLVYLPEVLGAWSGRVVDYAISRSIDARVRLIAQFPLSKILL